MSQDRPMAAINRLDPLALPLYGSRLIEASAGTGKTFTLAMLYLRLILGKGRAGLAGDPSPMSADSPPQEGPPSDLPPRDLLPPDILVVTFTNAATDELRDRVRRRLVEAAALFRGELADTETDAVLLALRAQLASLDPRVCARRLEAAADWMDESAISTIHAWCYRMLREHAFESGQAFGQQLQDSAGALPQQAAEDYWRTFLMPLPLAALRRVLGYWASPTRLKAAVVQLLPLADCIPSAQAAPEQSLRRCEEARTSRVNALKQAWREAAFADQLERLFEDAVRAKAFNQRSLNRGHRGDVLNALREWQRTVEQVWPKGVDGQGKSWRRMSSLAIGEIWLKPEDAPTDHPACRAVAELHRELHNLPDPYPELLAHALHWIDARIESEKQSRAELTQHDLLVRLDAALQSERGEALAASIRRQFPVALVDEFQDTDPLQYRIFNSIYRVKASAPETGFLMVGDPKQAIYSFRGADIYTYLAARRETAGRHYTLNTNYRSTPSLIAAVNAIFEFGEQRSDRGAFLFRDADENPVPFVGVEPKPDASSAGKLTIDGEPNPPLQGWLIADAGLTKTDYADRMALATAREIARLLRMGRQGRARLPDDQGQAEQGPGERGLRPNDIAVLVNNWREAELVRAQLRRLGVASVYLSERNSVFDTAVAKDLLVLLRAIASPMDERLLRQALAVRCLGLGLSALDRLNHDELYWEAQGERFRGYHALWRRQGLLPLLYRVLADFTVAARLLRLANGERELTDLLHLGELLHEASQQLDGEQAVVRFLEESVRDVDEVSEAQQLRLESDEQLVKVVTIHKSKGLEYPLVFLPFVVNCRAVKAKDLPLKTHDAARQLRLHLSADESIVQQADQERLGEDLRKLYVALTRARFGNWLGIGATADLPHSAFGYLLGTSAADLEEGLSRLGCLRLKQEPDQDPETLVFDRGQRLDNARPAPPTGLSPWWIASYSSLRITSVDAAPEFVSAVATASPSADTARQETALEEAAQSDRLATDEGTVARMHSRPQQDKRLHGLPRGSIPGTFLHGILEWAAVQRGQDVNGTQLRGFAAAAASPALRLEMLGRRCNLRGLRGWIEPLNDWLADFLERRWSLHGLADATPSMPRLALRDLPPRQVQVEMEFWLESHRVQTAVIDQLVQRHVLVGRQRPGLDNTLLNGMLKGFIDLVFEHQGRYYVVDWKSNWLGADDSAYSAEAMREAILHARYDLQYVLYLLALHRQLRARLPGYDYDRHIGGAVYVFLRGAYSDSQGLYTDKPPRLLIETLDRLLAGKPPLVMEQTD